MGDKKDLIIILKFVFKLKEISAEQLGNIEMK